jgi:maltooligosyltrehalose trehalohydrolase
MGAAAPAADALPFEHPLGARPRPGGGTAFRVWAPHASTVAVVIGADTLPAEPVGHGVWELDGPEVGHGTGYRYLLDGESHPDPWSRWQPEGTTGPSAVVHPAAIGAGAPGRGGRPERPHVRLDETVVYELHVGTFSTDGTFDGAVEHLAGLAELGITHVEVMPVGQFPGDRGWGYDGIFWSAAQQSYGGPAGLVRLVDAAHDLGLGVVLDVVYNHVGPTGDGAYDAHGPFFTDRHGTPWGRAINVDGPGSGAVRETIVQNAEWWVGTIGVDGLRVDACHAIVDQGARHVLAELTDRVRRLHPDALLIAESGLNDPRTVTATDHGGWGFDADWSDDFHHSLRTLLTDDRQGWYVDFGEVAQLAKAFDRPYVHDGTWSGYRGRRFGAPAGEVDPERFVVFAQNHDQVGNRPLGDRLPADVRRLAALCTLLSPFTPMLFQGEEYGEDAPFLFFSDHRDDFIADATRNGRRAEFADFTAASGEEIPDPQAPATWERSRLTRRVDADLLDLHRRLLALRPQLPPVEPEITFDEDQAWLRVERGTSVLLANLAAEPRRVPTPPGAIQLATHAGTATTVTDDDPHLLLPARAGALLWKDDDAP